MVEAISGVNKRGEGFIHLSMEISGHQRAVLQATPTEARQIGQQIIEAAEAAETDSVLFQFLTDPSKVGLDAARAAAVLLDFRKWRELSGGVRNRDSDDPHWYDMLRRTADPPADPTKR